MSRGEDLSTMLDEAVSERSGGGQDDGDGGRRRAHARRRPSAGSRAVGVLGELLITSGVIIALFVVWQVYWTDVEGARAASTAVVAFEEELPDSPEQSGLEQTGEPPQEVAPAYGETFATMYVPRWGADWRFPIAEGVGTADVLDAGLVGHYPTSQMPGEVGNFALAGHRQTYGKPFRYVEELEVGDPIVVQTAQAWYVYRVTESQIVSPSAVEVIAPNPADPESEATDRMITLTTCHPLWSVAERWVVHGELDHWVDRADGRPQVVLDMEQG
jgi:sortase A